AAALIVFGAAGLYWFGKNDRQGHEVKTDAKFPTSIAAATPQTVVADEPAQEAPASADASQSTEGAPPAASKANYAGEGYVNTEPPIISPKSSFRIEQWSKPSSKPDGG